MARTEYVVWNDDGSARLKTDSPRVAEAHSRIGLVVTAETTDAPDPFAG